MVTDPRLGLGKLPGLFIVKDPKLAIYQKYKKTVKYAVLSDARNIAAF